MWNKVNEPFSQPGISLCCFPLTSYCTGEATWVIEEQEDKQHHHGTGRDDRQQQGAGALTVKSDQASQVHSRTWCCLWSRCLTLLPKTIFMSFSNI